MKKIILFLFFLISVSFAQRSAFTNFSGTQLATYANSQTDTAKVIDLIRPGGWLPQFVGLYFQWGDSISVTSIIVDFKVKAATVWNSYTVASTVTSTANAGVARSYSIKIFGTDNIPCAEQIRLRIIYAGSANGTSSATLSAWYWLQ